VCADAPSCERLKADFAALVTKAPPARQAPGQASVTPPGPKPQGQQTLASLLQSINDGIARSLYFSGRNLLVTTSLSQSPDGRLELRGHLCVGLTLASARRDIETCRASNPNSADTRVLFRVPDLDRTAVRMEDNAGTYRVLFLCRNKEPCVARPDKSAYFPGGFLACPSRDACTRLMADFFQLFDLPEYRPRPR
jgi:hypothetical protein